MAWWIPPPPPPPGGTHAHEPASIHACTHLQSRADIPSHTPASRPTPQHPVTGSSHQKSRVVWSSQPSAHDVPKQLAYQKVIMLSSLGRRLPAVDVPTPRHGRGMAEAAEGSWQRGRLPAPQVILSRPHLHGARRQHADAHFVVAVPTGQEAAIWRYRQRRHRAAPHPHIHIYIYISPSAGGLAHHTQPG